MHKLTVDVERIPGIDELAEGVRAEIAAELEREVTQAARKAAWKVKVARDRAAILGDREGLAAAMATNGGDAYAAVLTVLRRRSGMPMVGLAKAMGRHRATVAAVEAGRRRHGQRTRSDAFALWAAPHLGVEQLAVLEAAGELGAAL